MNIQVEEGNIKVQTATSPADEVRHVVLSAAELSHVEVQVHCTEAGCNEVFNSRSNLVMHLAKTHHASNGLAKKVKVTLFHCPEINCKYNLQEGQSFRRSTLLKQHYLKVHAPKNYICSKCSKGFSTQASCVYHARTCGQGFLCSCGVTYNSKEALLTHAKRKQHTLVQNAPVPLVPKITATPLPVAPRPDAAVPVHFLAAVALSELSRPITKEIGVQTEDGENRKLRKASPARAAGASPNKSTGRRRASTHTQTLAARTSTETQTSGDLLLRQAMIRANIPVKPAKRQNCQTQTLRSSNTSIKPNKRAHIETQTHRPNKRQHNETQTIKLSKKSHCETQTSKQNKRSNSETQTFKINIAHCIETQTQSLETMCVENNTNESNLINYNKIVSNNETLSIQNDIEKSSEIQNELKSANLTEIETEISLKEFTPSRLIINDVSLPEIWLNQKSTQTSPSEQNISCFSPFRTDETLENLLTDDRFQSSETQTELAGFTAKFLEECDTNFTLCSHIETQTCDELNNSFEEMGSQMDAEDTFDEMLHSNMYTQTCDQLLLDFADIQTQTWPETSSSPTEQNNDE